MIGWSDMFNWSKHLVNDSYNIHVVATDQISDNQMRKTCEGLSNMVEGIKPTYRPYIEGFTALIHSNPHDGVSTGAGSEYFIIDREAYCSTRTPTTGSVTPNTWKTFVHEAGHTIASRLPGADSANLDHFPDPSGEYWAWTTEDWYGVTESQTREGVSSSNYNHLARWYRTDVEWDAPVTL